MTLSCRQKLSALLREQLGAFCCLNCLHSFATEKIPEAHKKLCENKDFSNVIMPSEDTKILGFNQYQKSDKPLFFIYANLKCVIKKIDGCKNNIENSSATKVSKHIPSVVQCLQYLHLEA